MNLPHGEKKAAGKAGLYGAEAGRLLDRETPEEYFLEWTERIARAKAETRAEGRSVLIFRLGNEWLAFPTKTLHEIRVFDRSFLHRLPHRDNMVHGLVGIRGDLMLCASLGALLGLEEEAGPAIEERSKFVLVLEDERGPVAFLVDAVYGVHTHHPDDLKDIPTTLAAAMSRTIPSGMTMPGAAPPGSKMPGTETSTTAISDDSVTLNESSPRAAQTPYTKGLLSWRDHAVGCLDADSIMRSLNTSLL